MAMQVLPVPAGESESIFQSNLPLEAKLERARTELLDLSARNRLLNIPRSGKSAKVLEIVDEHSREVFRLLVRDQRPFTFLAGRAASDAKGPDGEDEIAELAQPEDDGVDERGVASRHSDTKLQTRLTPAGLQKRLLDLYYDARTLEEEQGVNILFLALGTLKWVDPNNAANVRYAPLILIPVALERGNATEKFKLRWRQEEPAANLSLEAYLDRVHGLKLPIFEGGEDVDLPAYFGGVAETAFGKPGWTVHENDIVLGFFSFAKFLMYRDLDPANWPPHAKLNEHEIIKPLVSDGFGASEPLLAEDEPVDAHVPPSDMLHIVDSDSSQTMAVHEVRRGRNLVIQGPPGTGKSQTIANIIGSAVADGKTVLFVAEKMAALEVVKRRLDNTGVGDACLELHSNKTNKRSVLDELRRTWELGAPRGDSSASLNARLTEARDALNAHADRLHKPLGAAGFTPYQVIGHLIRLRQSGQAPTDVRLDDPTDWSADDVHERSALLVELSERVADIGVPAEHLWRGVELLRVLPPDVDRLIGRITQLSDQLSAMRADQAALAGTLETSPPETLAAIETLQALAMRLAGAPNLAPDALGAAEWETHTSAIATVLAAGTDHAALTLQLTPTFNDAAWETDVTSAREAFDPLPGNVGLDAFDSAEVLADGVPALLEEAGRLAMALGREVTPKTLRDIDELTRLAECVAAAPDATPEAFSAELWNSEVERAGELAAAINALEKARSEIGSRFNDAVWSADLNEARRVLAAHGTGFLRILNGEWRAANRLVRSFLATPKMPLNEQLTLLDALARGQAARAIAQTEASFGRAAFAADWRGERSSAAPLLALVEWMRSLRGLGPEPRIIAAKLPDRDHLRGMAARVSELANKARAPISSLWHQLSASRASVFADATGHDRVELDHARARLARLRDAHVLYRTITKVLDPSLVHRRANLTALAEGQIAALRVIENSELGATVFGPAWGGLSSNWRALRAAAEWIGDNLDIYELASRVNDRADLARRCALAVEERKRFLSVLSELLVDLRADTSSAVVAATAAKIQLPELSERLTAWRDGSELLSKWVAYRSRARKADALGMADLVVRLHAGRLPPDQALLHFEMSYFEAVFAAQVASVPDLAHFDGDLHNRAVRSFVDLDRQRIRQSAHEVVRAHHRRIPPVAGGALGPLGVLKSEIARKRGHMPIRQLMQRAAPAVQALKPVFMMSPLSVAQFLQPGTLTFDLLVMDEASQIQPVDALGAIARCRQVVVVGDPQQLPPTAFFAKMTGGAETGDDEEGAARVADIESVLGLFTARGLPIRMLRWHYRSRHQSLIAVSNRQFYENKLFIVPSPYIEQAGLGLRFHHVEDGIFETGTTRTNPIEAKVVARAIINHAIRYPDLSLGVATFSAAQRRAIQDQLELLRRALPPEHEAFFRAHPAEPFFIKNLENVQGDERDVIFISVGYGPTAPGLRPPMRFGPLGNEGGERRLNVLISRAKRRCDIFASMTDEDIDEDFASARKGVFAFKLFMHFARTGQMAMAKGSGRDHDSVFEEQVAQALQERGYQVQRQVGIAGFFIDLAVADPERTDRFLLGIECDGAAYHTARSARDRDRLRLAVLEDHGWIIHRIWSTDWFRRPKEQLDRVIGAVEAAKSELATRSDKEAGRARATSLEIVSVDRDDVTEIGLVALETASPKPVTYVEAVLSKPVHLACELHEAPTGSLTALAEQVVAIEGPVHIDEVVNRIRDAWGLRRAGARIQDAVERAIEVAVKQQRLAKDGRFYSVPGSEPVVRDRNNARSLTLRKPEALPPSEIKAALIDIISQNFGATEEQAVLAVSRAVGFKSTSAQLRDVIASVLSDLVDKAVLTRKDGLVDVGPNAPVRAAKIVDPTPVERLIAEGENEKLEFKQTLCWDVYQQTRSKKIEESAIRAVAAFANHSGGTLLIGVSDDGAIIGLDQDLTCLHADLDKMELHLTNLLNHYFTAVFRATKVKVTFPSVGEKLICRIDVQRSRTPVYVKVSDHGGNLVERLFVRSGNSSQEVPLSQIASFVKDHFE